MEYYDLEARVKKDTPFANATIEIVAGTETDLVKGKTTLPFGMVLVHLQLIKGEVHKSPDLSSLGFLWVDYQPNQFAWPMMSERMADIVKSHLTGEEGIDWISAQVTARDETRVYYIPRFSILFDIWDKEKTVYSVGKDFIVNPWFSKERVARLALFYKRPEFWEITPSLVVNESLMKALKKAKLTGIGFSPARFS